MSIDIVDEISRELEKRRLVLGMSRRRFAFLLGMSESYFTLLQQGKRTLGKGCLTKIRRVMPGLVSPDAIAQARRVGYNRKDGKVED